jgi:choline dehydrogenase-like flavoprotein
LGKAGGPLRRKGVRIDWHPGDVPVVMTKMMSEHLRAFWKRNGLDRIAELKFSSEEALRNSWPANLYDIYHPAGTTRMTLQPDHGVVGPDLRVFGTDNVHVLSTSVFPSMGAANPTFTLMALGLRLARHLAGEKPDDATFPRRH